MLTDRIYLGETYTISASGQDENGAAFAIPGTWEVKARIMADTYNGDVVADLTLAIANGVASVSMDTGNSPFAAGIYFYDIRITDADGNDFWSDMVKLVITTRITPQST